VRGRKFDLEPFLNQHGVEICLLIENFLNPGQTFRVGSYVCHRKHRPTAVCGSVFLVRHGIVQNSVAVLGLTQQVFTAIQITLVGRTVKNLGSCLSPSCQMIGEDLTPSFGSEGIADHFGRRREIQTRI
jgi:hypothetical protein